MHLKTIILKNAITIRQIDIQTICYITIDIDCVTVFFVDNSKFSCSKSLQEMQEILPSHFIKIARGCIVNLFKVKELRLKQRKVILYDGTELQVAFRRFKSIKCALMDNTNTPTGS